MMWIRYPNTPGHNKNDGTLSFIPIIMKVSKSLDAGKFQCVLNTSTMEMLKILPPSQEKSLQETKQAAKRLRKQMRDMTRRQEVFRIKKLHENIEKNRRHNIMSTHITTASSHDTHELPVMSHGTFHAASVETISTSNKYRCLAITEKSKPIAMG